MEYGAHLPLIDFGAGFSRRRLKAYARAAAESGYRYLCANDHLLYPMPWLDGPTSLAALIEESGDLTLATTVSLPVLRGPVQLAKTLAALDVLSDGRLVVGVGPGSSARDYAALGLPFDDRWRLFNEAVPLLRSLLEGGEADLDLEPRSPQRPGPPIWIGSWGSPAGLRRVARLGDGWLASAYNTTPDEFAGGRDRLGAALLEAGKEPTSFPNALATSWLYVDDDPAGVERVLADVLAPMLNRPVDALRALSLPIGPAEVCAERLSAFAAAGVERVFLWPLEDDVRQLELFQSRVAPLVSRRSV
ncbi:MAG TPA: LLM class flavin-dependent oxidoreductase [Gaiellaceae bacterium]|nr:LLM class flavin-dependent oxidoreductase [Gaiellaceae bacterium]